jgi:tricorn protease
VGDVITAIDSTPFSSADTIESRLTGRINEEILLTVRRKLGDGEPTSFDVLTTPVGWNEERQLKYRALRRRRAELVSEWTNGRVGYIHIQAMGQEALDVFERDLFAAAEGKDGLIIDVRDNGGGWTTDRLLSSIMVQPHAYTIPRGADAGDTGHYPQDRLFIQRYSLPINMMCNENSYSNAEIISHAFKTLKRGTLVGTETFGAVISTGGTALIDGTFVRLPFRGWFLLDGTDMEDAGAVPDIIVEQTPDAEASGDDVQLRAAVDDLLKRL